MSCFMDGLLFPSQVTRLLLQRSKGLYNIMRHRSVRGRDPDVKRGISTGQSQPQRRTRPLLGGPHGPGARVMSCEFMGRRYRRRAAF